MQRLVLEQLWLSFVQGVPSHLQKLAAIDRSVDSVWHDRVLYMFSNERSDVSIQTSNQSAWRIDPSVERSCKSI